MEPYKLFNTVTGGKWAENNAEVWVKLSAVHTFEIVFHPNIIAMSCPSANSFLVLVTGLRLGSHYSF